MLDHPTAVGPLAWHLEPGLHIHRRRERLNREDRQRIFRFFVLGYRRAVHGEGLAQRIRDRVEQLLDPEVGNDRVVDVENDVVLVSPRQKIGGLMGRLARSVASLHRCLHFVQKMY